MRLVQALAIAAVFISSSLMLSRHLFTVLITGLAISYLIRKTANGRLTWKQLGTTLLVLAPVGAFLFFLISSLKGTSDIDTQIATLLGYTVASYNRLAALLHGTLHFEYSGTGIYFSSFAAFNNLFNRVIPLRSTLSYPDFLNWWMSEFASVGRAGLQPTLIFCGTFGEIFAEIGWFSPFYVFCYGLMYGLMWRWVIAGRLVGIVMYPYFGYCVLFWFSTNGLFDQDAIALFVDVLILGAYEWLFMKQSRILLQVPQAG